MALSPAINGTEQRLDVLIRQNEEILSELRSRGLTPAAPAASEIVELREPSPLAQSPAVSAGPKPSRLRWPKAQHPDAE